MPPDASKRWVLTHRASPEQRKATTPLMSSGTPTWPSPVCEARNSLIPGCGSKPPLVKSVSCGHGICADAAGAEFLCQIAGEHLDGALHRRICGVSGNCEPGESRRDADNHAAVGDHRQQILRKEIDSLEVHEEQTIEVFFGHPVKRRSAVDAGVVD